MTKFAIVQGLSIVAVVLVGCGGADPTGTGDQSDKSGSAATKKAAPATSASPTEPTPAPAASAACVVEGDKGNAKGIGAYCDMTVRCADGQICSGDFGAPVGASFCTVPCSTDAECGDGASCYADPRGQGCAPLKCQGK